MKYDKYIYKIVRQWMGLDEDDKSRDNEINSLSPREVFEAILEWDGIIGYGDKILRWIEDCFNIKVNTDKVN